MAIGVLLTLRMITLNGRSNGDRLLAILLLAGSGAFTYYARVGNFDVPYLFWWSLSLGLLWKYLHTETFARRREGFWPVILAAGISFGVPRFRP